jgi:phage replication O-like protein O
MVKKGFRKIDNDTFTALMAAGLSGASYQVVLTIMDRTMGFRKGSGFKEKSKIPLTYFQQVTGLSRQSIRLGIKQAEARRIIVAERSSTRPTVYALNLDTGEWLARKLNHPSELGNKITLDWETKSPQARKPAMPRTTDAKETLKQTLKAKDTIERNTPHLETPSLETPIEGVSTTQPRVSTTPPMSLSLLTPKGKAEANSLTNGLTVLPGEDRATLESDLSALGSPSRGAPLREHKATYQQRITAYLGAHGPATIKTIAQATGIKANSVNLILHKGKDKLFHHFRAERVWGVNE